MSEQSANPEEGSTYAPDIPRDIRTFIDQVEGLATTHPFVGVVLLALQEQAGRDLNNFLAEHGTVSEIAGDKKMYTLPLEKTKEADKLQNNCTKFQHGVPILFRQFVISLISQYDAFLGRLLKSLFYLQPGLLNSSELNLSFEQLVTMSSIKDARDYIIEKEIDRVLRLSHSEQFEWMEKKFKVTLTKGLDCWADFIELTERRNLFVHVDGIVNMQYLKVCKQHGVKFAGSPPLVGSRLTSNKDYFYQAFQCIFEIAVKLSQVLWRKISPDSLNDADANFNDITFELICSEQYDIAINLLLFGKDVLKKHSSEKSRLIIITNLAQAYKWKGQNDKCISTLKDEDWSACGIPFRLAVAVLTDDFPRAAYLMKQMGPKGEISEEYYKDWPLFKEFRKSNQFLETFQEVYQKPFEKIITTTAKDASALAASPPEEAT